MKIILKNSSDAPIYEQIEEQLRAQILDGAMPEGEQLPSIRSLARDLKILCAGGFEILSVQPVDMFPFTHHIETVVHLRRNKATHQWNNCFPHGVAVIPQSVPPSRRLRRACRIMSCRPTSCSVRGRHAPSVR